MHEYLHGDHWWHDKGKCPGDHYAPGYVPRTLRSYTRAELEAELERRDRDEADTRTAQSFGVTLERYRDIRNYVLLHSGDKK